MSSPTVARLRAELVRRFPTAVPRPAPRAAAALATGYPALDAVLPDGGLPRGRISEIVGPPSSGKLSVALGVLAQLTRQGELCAFIDGRGEFFAPSAEAAGVDLGRLLVVRPAPPLCLEAAGVVVQSRAFALAVLDTGAAGAPPRGVGRGMIGGGPPDRSARLEAAHAARLRRLCEEGDTALVLLTEPATAPAGRPLREAAALRLRALPQLEGVRITIDKSAAGRVGAAADLRMLRYASYCLRAAAQLRLAGAPARREPGRRP
ncbi:MAG TPA: hypothetical protein VGQ83_14530 [Polyangia bacterium]